MTKQETKKIIAMMIAAYPGHFKQFLPADIDEMVNSWTLYLENYTYDQAVNGLKVFVTGDIKGFPPSIGQVVDSILSVLHPESENLTGDEAWAMVAHEIYNGFDYAEAFKKFPEIIQKIVGSPLQLARWGADENFNESVQKSLFLKSYKTMLERQRQDAKIPESVKKAIAMNEQKKIGGAA